MAVERDIVYALPIATSRAAIGRAFLEVLRKPSEGVVSDSAPSGKAAPTHITIVGGSQHTFFTRIAPYLLDQDFAYLITRIAPPPHAKIHLAPIVQTVADIRPILRHIERRGIPDSHIRVHYPAVAPQDLVKSALAYGLRDSGLGFGGDVAEHDSHLSNYFIQTSAYVGIASNRKHVVVGPKGSGKSAILRHLSAEKTHALVITPEHYATEILASLRGNEGTDELGAYIATWKYTLLVEIFRQLVRMRGGDSRSLQQLRDYLVANGHLASDLTLVERFLRYLKRIRNVKGKLGPVEIAVESGSTSSDELGHLFKMGELLELLPALRTILRRDPFAVYVDELDRSWDNSETANRFLVSLLSAAIDLRSIDPNLHAVVFLRTEIFDLLKPHLAQLDKLRSDTEILTWDERELTRLVVTRALYALNVDEDLEAEAVVRALFPGQIGGIEPFRYLMSRTGRRPREVIQFSNLALDVAARRGLGAVTADAVLQAEEQFSVWRREHIVAENLFVYPGVSRLLERFRGGSRQLSADELDGILVSAVLECQSDKDCPAWLSATPEPVALMQILYQMEVIGVERLESSDRDARQPWESYEWAYQRPNARVEKSNSFLIHPGLWKGLELR